MPKQVRVCLPGCRGETLVEVLVAFALLTLFLAVFAAARQTADNFLSRANARSEMAENLTEPLRGTGYADMDATPDGTARYEFYNESGDPAFTVETPRETVTVSAGGESCTFRRFTAPEPAAPLP